MQEFYAETTTLDLFEISPTEHKLAVLWTRGSGGSAQMDALDLDSGRQLSEWNPHDRGLGAYSPAALAWEPQGGRLVVAVPNSFRCNSPGTEPDSRRLDRRDSDTVDIPVLWLAASLLLRMRESGPWIMAALAC